MLFRTAFQFLRSIGQIIVFDKRMALVNALVLNNLCEYRHKSYTAKTRSFWLHFYSWQYGSSCKQFAV